MQIRSLALTAVTVGALGIAGCGGSSGTKTGAGSTTDAKTLLASTFQPTSGSSKIKSGDIKITASGKLSGTPGGSGSANAEIKLGQAQSGGIPEFSATVQAKGEETGGAKLDLDAGGVFVDNRFYVSYQGTNYDVGQELSARAIDSLKAAIKQSGADADNQQDVLGKLGLNPQTWLTNPTVQGTDKIGGVDTYRIGGQVNIKTLVPDVLNAARKAQSLAPNSSARAVPTVTDAQLDAAAKQIKTLDVTIWTGKDDHILRQLKVDLDMTGASAADDLSGTIQITLTGVNQQQDIKAPSNTKPVTDLIPKLNGLFGAAAGGAAATGAGTSPNAAVSQAYIECVNKAGNDAAKLNACQSQLK